MASSARPSFRVMFKFACHLRFLSSSSSLELDVEAEPLDLPELEELDALERDFDELELDLELDERFVDDAEGRVRSSCGV